MNETEATDTPLTLEAFRKAIDDLEQRRETPGRVVSPQFYRWVKDHTVTEEEATHHVWGVPVRVNDD